MHKAPEYRYDKQNNFQTIINKVCSPNNIDGMYNTIQIGVDWKLAGQRFLQVVLSSKLQLLQGLF